LFLRELRSLVKEIILETTPRIQDLSREEIAEVLEDILGREPLNTYTEKLAGQFLEVKIDGDKVLTIFKDAKEKGFSHGYRHDAGATASTLRSIQLPEEMIGQIYQFEVIKQENRPDYIDYIIGDKTLAIEFTGRMSKELSQKLNELQSMIRFVSQSDIIRRPKNLSDDTRTHVQRALNSARTSQKMSKPEKESIESLISKALVEIFGESLLGGSPEGIFVSSPSRSFKIPEYNYSNIQRLQAPLYAIFSDKSKYTPVELGTRFESFTGNPHDRMAKQIKDYLVTASKGFPPGFRTFFSPEEASKLLGEFEELTSGDLSKSKQVLSQLKRRIGNKHSWVSTR
jgi:hypothetical protein